MPLIIYVRGFGDGQSGIDKVVTDPFYGFNEGSTMSERGSGEKLFPLVRGFTPASCVGAGYTLFFEGNQQWNYTRPAMRSWPRHQCRCAGSMARIPGPSAVGRNPIGL